MRLVHLGPVWAACLLRGVAAGREASTEEPRITRNIAIIGAGAAGSSAAYHLRQYARDEGLAINVTVFEKSDRVGGRCITANAFDDPLIPIELGASIFVTINHVLYNASRTFGLPLSKLSIHEKDDVTAIWDGRDLVFQTTDDTPSWWDAGKMFWKYGTSPYWATKLVDDVVGKFLKLYEPPFFPFRSLTARAFELGLVNITGLTGEQFLAQNKINPKFSREIIQAATRVNYASNLAFIHALEAMVSISTGGAVSVEGGNWKMFQHMLDNSGATIHRNTAVTAMTHAKAAAEPGSPPRYLLSTKESSSSSSQGDEHPTAFDDVIIASPWQFSNIDAASVLERHIEEIPYTKLHVTLFTSPLRLRAGFFNLDPAAKPPSSVFTTLAEDEEPRPGAAGVGRTGFYSVSTLRTVTNPATQAREFVYKIFSPGPVTPAFLSDLLGQHVPDSFTAEGSPISWYFPHWFHSYPIELPRVTFQDPVVGDGLWYTSGIEGFISTMETSALMGMNVAKLIADDMVGRNRNASMARGHGGVEDDKGPEAFGEL